MIVKCEEDGSSYLRWTGRPDQDETLVTFDDPLVTVAELVSIWESRLEGANYHSMIVIAENFVRLMATHGVAEATVKAMLWDILENHGAWMS